MKKMLLPLLIGFMVSGCSKEKQQQDEKQKDTYPTQTLNGVMYKYIGRDTIGVYEVKNKVSSFLATTFPEDNSSRRSVYFLQEGKVITRYTRKDSFSDQMRSLPDMFAAELSEFQEAKRFQNRVKPDIIKLSREDSLLLVIKNMEAEKEKLKKQKASVKDTLLSSPKP